MESEITKDGARTLAQYTYNASGYRTSKTVNGVTTEHVLDGANVAADVANGQVTQYVRGLGLTALVQADGTRLQYVTDVHGDVKKLMDGSGAVVVDYAYDAFGNQTSETEDSNPFRYSGEYYDAETGLIYLRARYYDSGVGGFISEDPAKDGLNWYVYCGGNPVNHFDYTGLEPVLIRYVVEKNGGYVSYYADDGTNQGPRVDVTLFDSNNVAHTASFYHLTEVNDRLVIDSGALAAAVGYAKSDSELRHAEYDRFNSEADAVIAFGLTYHEKSLNERQEYGAAIDEVNGQYYFHDVSNSARTAGKNVNDLTDRERRSTAVWGVNDNTTANVHTHWHPSGNLTFSDPDDYDATYGTHSNIERIYLVNRNGEIIQSTRNARLERGYTMGIKRFQI